jgi:hypothetical protein
VLLGWVYFRAGTIGEAHLILARILDLRGYTFEFVGLLTQYARALPMLMLFVIIEYLQRKKQHILEINRFGYLGQALILSCVIMVMLLAGAGVQAQFIYFRF